jgi:hypothetical protein
MSEVKVHMGRTQVNATIFPFFTSEVYLSGTLMEEVSGGKEWSIGASHAIYTA